jgi:hypothetical protein
MNDYSQQSGMGSLANISNYTAAIRLAERDPDFNYDGVIVCGVWFSGYIIIILLFLIFKSRPLLKQDTKSILYDRLFYHPITSPIFVPLQFTFQKVYRLSLLLYHNLSVLGFVLGFYIYEDVELVYCVIAAVILTDFSMYLFFGCLKFFIFGLFNHFGGYKPRSVISGLLVFAISASLMWIGVIIWIVGDITETKSQSWATGAFTGIGFDLFILDTLVCLLMAYETDLNVLHYYFRAKGVYWNEEWEHYYVEYEYRRRTKKGGKKATEKTSDYYTKSGKSKVERSESA